MLASGSVDQTGTYVFEVEPRGIGGSRSQFTNYWDVAHGNDTMFSPWNPTAAAQDISVTFYFGDGSGKYILPVHLEAQASTMIDMAKLIAEHKPDSSGNVIPSNIQEGSAEFASAKGRSASITLVVAGGIYNVSTATCGGTCTTCCGVSRFGVSPNPILCPIGDTMPCSSTAVDCSGSPVAADSWSSSNTAVMTVDNYGRVQGVAAGQALIANYFNNVVDYSCQVCEPYSYPQGSHSGGTYATVQKPGFLQLVSSSTTGTCQGRSCEDVLTYRVLDVNQAPMNIPGMTIKESISPDNGTCHATISDSSTWTTNATGYMIGSDIIWFCCNGAACQVPYTQNFTVNGFGVLLLSSDGTRTGTHNAITANCDNGNGACPNVVITP